jgi:hypothetical protein
MTSGRRAKGIEPSYSAWKGIPEPNDLKSGSEKCAAEMGRNSHSVRTRATATKKIATSVGMRGHRIDPQQRRLNCVATCRRPPDVLQRSGLPPKNMLNATQAHDFDYRPWRKPIQTML